MAAGLLWPALLSAAAPTPDNDAAKVYNTAPNGSSFSANYTVLAGSSQILLVVIECETCSAPTSVAYNGVGMTQVVANPNGSGLNVWTYYLVNPPTGAADPIAVTLGGGYFSNMAVFAMSYSGVNQTTPIGNTASSSTAPGMSGGVSNVNLGFTPSSSSSTVVEISYERQPAGAALSLDHGAVRFVSNNVSNNTNGDYGFGDWNPPSTAAVTLKYTWTLAGQNTGNIVDVQAIELMPAGASGTPTNTPTSTPTVTPTWTPTATPSATPTATPSFTASPTYTATPSASRTATPSFTVSPTVTPQMALTKTSSVATATLGDTITFCITYKNNSSGTVTIPIWDTVSSFLTYQGCNTGCSFNAGARLVSWSIASVASGAGGTVCFWGTVNGYPFLPELLDPGVRLARREDLDLLFGRLDPRKA